MKNEVSYGSYSDWVVDREELKPIKRRNNCNDPEKRMYSIFKCKYCNIDFDVATEFLSKYKKRCIDSHLSICKSYTGERPAKRNKIAMNSHTVTIPSVTMTTTVVPVSNTQQSSRIEQLEKEMAEVKGMVAQHHIYWGCVATSFGYTPPQDPPFLIDKIRELKQQQPILLEYKEIAYENKKIIELKNEEIQQKNKELELDKEHIKRIELEIAESNKKVDELTQELKKATAKTERLKRENEKRKREYNKKQADDEYKRTYGMQAFLRKQALEAQKPGCLFKPS